MSKHQRTAFEKALEKDPYDKATRLVFADWLEENGTQPGDDDLAREQREWTKEKHDAKVWLADFGKRMVEGYNENQREYAREEPNYTPDLCDVPTVEELVEIGRNYLRNGHTHCLPFDTPDVCYTDSKEFLEKVSILTGTPVREDDSPYIFRCAC